jgi:23S rRNA (uracil1939-C5)-methyltransferase
MAGRGSGDGAETVHVEKMAAGGDGIARLGDGRVVFVDGALPGETVRVAVHTSKRDFAKGSVTEVLEPSPHRLSPPCPELAAGCGGCAWQHIAPEAQLGWKAEIVADALRRTGRLPDAAVGTRVALGSSVPPWGYRTTMRLAVAVDGRVGLRAGSSHRVVTLGSCMVAHPTLACMLGELRVRGADEVSLRVSVTTGEATLWADTAGAEVDGLPATVKVGPDAALNETVAGVSLRVSAASFFQSGPAAAELLVAAVRDACGDALRDLHGPLLDAYGGIGLFAATLGAEASIVVESSASSCADATFNLGDRAEVVRGTFEQWRPRPVSLAVVDPARAGLGKGGTAVLAATGAARVVLVSCDPVSLARDTVLLASHGYRHAGSTVFDLFPHTPHVEVVTRFDKA